MSTAVPNTVVVLMNDSLPSSVDSSSGTATPPRSLRRHGRLLALGSGPVGALTEIPSGLLFYAGLSLLPIAVLMALVAMWPVHPATWLVIVGNGLWVAGSLLLLLGVWFTPNTLGAGLIIGQALAVAVLAWLEHAEESSCWPMPKLIHHSPTSDSSRGATLEGVEPLETVGPETFALLFR